MTPLDWLTVWLALNLAFVAWRVVRAFQKGALP
jgi:hypothetical protein